MPSSLCVGEIGPIAKPTNLPQLCTITLALKSWKTKCVRLAPELLGALSPYRTHPINRFGMYELRKGTGTGRLRRDVRDRTTKWVFSKVTIVSLDILLLIYEGILTPTLPRSRRRATLFDWAGQAASLIALSALTFGLIEAGEVGITRPEVLVSLATAVMAGFFRAA
jgi:hypothetical protein